MLDDQLNTQSLPAIIQSHTNCKPFYVHMHKCGMHTSKQLLWDTLQNTIILYLYGFLMNYKYDNPKSLLRVIFCQINRFENKPLHEKGHMACPQSVLSSEFFCTFFYLFFGFQSINNIKSG